MPVKPLISLVLLLAVSSVGAPDAPASWEAISGASRPRVWLGVLLGDAPDGGVEIVGLVSGGPAERAGLREGDLVLGLNGRPVAARGDVDRYLRDLAPADEVLLEVLQDGRTERRRTLRVRPGALPSWTHSQALVLPPRILTGATGLESVAARPALGGALVTAIPEELRVHYGAPSEAGVLVTRVEDRSAAAAAGVRVGDVLVSIGGRRIRRPEDVWVALVPPPDERGHELQLVRAREALTVDLAPDPSGLIRFTLPVAEFSSDEERAESAASDSVGTLEREVEELERRLRQLREELERLKDKERR